MLCTNCQNPLPRRTEYWYTSYPGAVCCSPACIEELEADGLPPEAVADLIVDAEDDAGMIHPYDLALIEGAPSYPFPVRAERLAVQMGVGPYYREIKRRLP